MSRTCINGKVFVATSGRWGNVRKRGYDIPHVGQWIAELDADELVEETDEVFCFRTNSTIIKNLVFYATPNEAQVRQVTEE